VKDALNSPAVVAVDDAAQRLVLQLRGHHLIDRTVYLLSEAANHSAMWHSINAVDALVSGREGRRRAMRRSAIIAAEQALVNGPIKFAVKRKRPVELESHPHRLRRPRTSSFPSGHASAGACAATLLTQDLGGALLWWPLAGVVGYSMIHVGVHHASDVIGGVLVGRALAAAAGLLWPARRSGRRN
jgi:undecaprenyl-diphosphatase